MAYTVNKVFATGEVLINNSPKASYSKAQRLARKGKIKFTRLELTAQSSAPNEIRNSGDSL